MFVIISIQFANIIPPIPSYILSMFTDLAMTVNVSRVALAVSVVFSLKIAVNEAALAVLVVVMSLTVSRAEKLSVPDMVIC